MPVQYRAGFEVDIYYCLIGEYDEKAKNKSSKENCVIAAGSGNAFYYAGISCMGGERRGNRKCSRGGGTNQRDKRNACRSGA